jgi:hypothetical protein
MSGTVNDPSQAILNGPSVDQVLAAHIGNQTPFDSLQLGLSTHDSYPDGQHPAISRSISWLTENTPLYKEVNPQAVFDRLIMQLGPGGNASPEAIAQAELRKARDLSVLDYVLGSATSLQPTLSTSDRARLDQFMTSVRDLETRIALQMPGASDAVIDRPELSAEYHERDDIKSIGVDIEPVGYSRDEHAETMNDLITMAFQTDLTRVIAHMLDDARSDYHYMFLRHRTACSRCSGRASTRSPWPRAGPSTWPRSWAVSSAPATWPRWPGPVRTRSAPASPGCVTGGSSKHRPHRAQTCSGSATG